MAVFNHCTKYLFLMLILFFTVKNSEKIILQSYEEGQIYITFQVNDTLNCFDQICTSKFPHVFSEIFLLNNFSYFKFQIVQGRKQFIDQPYGMSFESSNKKVIVLQNILKF